MIVKDSILAKTEYSNSDWRNELVAEQGKSNEDRREELAGKILHLFEGYNNLKTINLGEILNNIANNIKGDEHQAGIEKIIKLNRIEVDQALEKLGVSNPLLETQDSESPNPEDVKLEVETNNIAPNKGFDDDDLLSEAPLIKGETTIVPNGYKIWSATEIENHENKLVAYWTTQGEYGKGKFFVHEKKRHEFCFRPEGGRLVVLTTGHKRKLSTEGSDYRFKALKNN
ncbi:MAG: hypothetical protein GY786_24535 [Proteobacteria bacterium]|nr:hypothetical protein [Pseudomonadota bacterium]